MKTRIHLSWGLSGLCVLFFLASAGFCGAEAPRQQGLAGAAELGGYAGEGGGMGVAGGMLRIGSLGRGVVFFYPQVHIFEEQKDMRLGGLYRVSFPSNPTARLTVNPRYDRQYLKNGDAFDVFSAFTEYRIGRFTGRLSGAYSPDDAKLVERVVQEERVPGGGTLRRTLERYRAPLNGVDGELGLQLPLPGWMGPARILGGFYMFDADKVGKSEGWTGRFEYRPIRWLSLDTVAYADRRFSRIDWFGGARVVFSFGGGASGSEAAPDLDLPPIRPRSGVATSGLIEDGSGGVFIPPPNRPDPEEDDIQQPFDPDEFNGNSTGP